MMLSFVEDCLSSCYEVPIPFHRYYTYNFCLHTTNVITNTDTLLKHTHTHTAIHTHPQQITTDTTSKKWRGVKNKKKNKNNNTKLSFSICLWPHACMLYHPKKQSVQNSLLYINRNLFYRITHKENNQKECQKRMFSSGICIFHLT